MNFQEGQLSSVIYGLIRDEQWNDSIEILQQQLAFHPKSRAALSLLGYCHYQTEQFEVSAKYYEQLMQLCPSANYQLNYAQCCLKAGLYKQALKAASFDVPADKEVGAMHLRAACKYEQDDTVGTRQIVESLLSQGRIDDARTYTLQACLLHKEGKFEEALESFEVYICSVIHSVFQ
ncbi:hypothetical protein KIPB_006400, partial [Kipferlia bialata]|eukprot:g6400.t1